ncbi:hypothetical protein MIR68_007984 [Amoeboaphelidium protococcarum]|nr:hypothetical protein MIR68_007984 [Amoeboaphelidium protococcarum]
MEDTITYQLNQINRNIAEAQSQTSSYGVMLLQGQQGNMSDDILKNFAELLLKSQLNVAQLIAQREDLIRQLQNFQLSTSQKKPKVVSFSSAQYHNIVEITGIDTANRKLTIPANLNEEVEPSDEFFAMLDRNCRVFVQNSEAARRTVIDLFLTDIVSRSEFQGLHVFCDQKVATRNYDLNLSLQGYVDYVIGHKGGGPIKSLASLPQDCHLVVHQARKEFPEESVQQCVAEAAAIYKNRKDASKVNPRVWGICSNATLWKFIHIDNDGLLYESDLFVLNRSDSGLEREDLMKIYRIIHHIILNAYLSSPTTTPHQSSHDLGEFVEPEQSTDTLDFLPTM